MTKQPYSSYYLDEYANLTEPPEKEALFSGDPEIYLARLDQIQAPRDRLIAFYKSLFDFANPSTYEARIVQQLTIAGTLASTLFGCILRSPDIYREYQMKHNASVYETHYRGNRHFYDTLITKLGAKSIRYGTRSFAFLSIAALIPTSSTVYRNQPHLLDHMVGFTAFGALSRLWLGPRAVLVGGFVGSIVGLLIFGSLKATELATGMSLAQLKYLEQVNFVQGRELKLRHNMEMKEKDHMENLEEVPRGFFD